MAKPPSKALAKGRLQYGSDQAFVDKKSGLNQKYAIEIALDSLSSVKEEECKIVFAEISDVLAQWKKEQEHNSDDSYLRLFWTLLECGYRPLTKQLGKDFEKYQIVLAVLMLADEGMYPNEVVEAGLRLAHYKIQTLRGEDSGAIARTASAIKRGIKKATKYNAIQEHCLNLLKQAPLPSNYIIAKDVQSKRGFPVCEADVTRALQEIGFSKQKRQRKNFTSDK